MVLLSGAVTPETTEIRSPKMTSYSSSPQRWLDYKRDDLAGHIAGGRSKTERNLMHNTTVRYDEEDDTFIIRYHNTDIITYHDDHIVIDIDGWGLSLLRCGSMLTPHSLSGQRKVSGISQCLIQQVSIVILMASSLWQKMTSGMYDCLVTWRCPNGYCT